MAPSNTLGADPDKASPEKRQSPTDVDRAHGLHIPRGAPYFAGKVFFNYQRGRGTKPASCPTSISALKPNPRESDCFKSLNIEPIAAKPPQ
jgi:hypothetical protein